MAGAECACGFRKMILVKKGPKLLNYRGPTGNLPATQWASTCLTLKQWTEAYQWAKHPKKVPLNPLNDGELYIKLQIEMLQN